MDQIMITGGRANLIEDRFQCPHCKAITRYDQHCPNTEVACPKCRKSFVTPEVGLHGPPHSCWHCDGDLEKGKNVSGQGVGCLIFLVGILLCFSIVGAIIGVPAILYGLVYTGKKTGFFQCKSCHSVFPRKLRWWE